MRDLSGIVERFTGRTIVVVGDLVADEYIYGQTDRISREAPVLIVRYEADEVKLGCAGNAAANLRALGAKVLPVGLVGADDMGKRLRKLAGEAGMDDRHIVVAPGRRTESKTRILAGGKNTTRQQMLRVDRANDGPIGPAVEQKLLRALVAAIEKADAVLVSDYGGGVLTALVAQLAVDAAPRMPVCVDSRYGIRSFQGATVVKPNEPELEAATGVRTGGDPGLLERAGRELLAALHSGAVLVTRGRSGMALFAPGVPTDHIPAHGAADAVDVTGAGDTVIAALTLALAAGADMLSAARLANVAGALVVQKPGTATVSQDELQGELGALGEKRPASGRAARKP